MFFKIMMRLVALPLRIMWGLSKMVLMFILPIVLIKAFKMMVRK